MEERPPRPPGTRWSFWFKLFVRRKDVDAFVTDIVQVCRKHGFALGTYPFPKPYGTLVVTELRDDTLQLVKDMDIASSVDALSDTDALSTNSR